MVRIKSISIAGLICSFLLLGCSEYSVNGPDNESQQPVQSLEAPSAAAQNVNSTEAEVFRVKFQSLNADVGYRPVKGFAQLNVQGGELRVKVNASGLQPGMIHPQHIHAAGSCPSPKADKNGDGIIDVVEGVPSYGGIFVPLDADLADLSFQTSFPKPDNNGGAITYTQSVSVDKLEDATGEPLDLDGRHIVLHGVSSDTDLPGSVQSLGGLPATLTLPVACGEIVRAN